VQSQSDRELNVFIFVAAYRSHIGLEGLATGAEEEPVFEEGEGEGILEGG